MTRPPRPRHDPLLDAASVAELLGLRHGTVLTYRYRGIMPEPDRWIGRSPCWYTTTIRRWDARRPKVDGRVMLTPPNPAPPTRED